MAQRSRFWDGTTIGDATVAPYDAGTEFSEVMTAVAGLSSDPNKGGLVSTISVSMFAPGTMRIGAFEALVYGAWYQNDANIDIPVATPSTATRIDTVVLRKSWAAQTVRVLVITGIEGGAAPAMVQTPGVTWDVPIASISTTTGGVTTITPNNTRADFWYRTSSNGIRTDNNAGINASPLAWLSGLSVMQLGQTMAVRGHTGSPNIAVTNNQFVDNTGTNRAMVTGPSGALTIGADASFAYAAAPSVAAGAAQTFNPRLTATEAGSVVIWGKDIGVNSSASLHLNTNGAQSPTHYTQILFGRSGSVYWRIGQNVSSQQADNFELWSDAQGSRVVANFSRAMGDFNLFPLQPGSNGAGVHVTRAWGTASKVFLGHEAVSGRGIFGWFDNGNNNTMGIVNGIFGGGIGDIVLSPSGAVVRPMDDTFRNFGNSLFRWAALWAVTGTIQTSHYSLKEDFEALDPYECAQAVMDTDWVKFSYLTPVSEIIDPDPVIDPKDDMLNPEERIAMNARRRAKSRQTIAEGATARRQNGYVLGSPDFRISEMFGLSDRKSKNNGSDLAIVACALQYVMSELAEVKAQLAQYKNGTYTNGNGHLLERVVN